MKILKGYRRCGKTTYSIKEAYINDATIITGNYMMKQIIEEQAKYMNMPISVITIHDYLRNQTIIRNEKFIIDQLEFIINELFKHNEIMFATTDLEVFTSAEWKKES